MKVMLLMWVLVVALRLALKAMASTMSDDEKYGISFIDEYMPTRVFVLMALYALSIVGALVATVIAIITW